MDAAYHFILCIGRTEGMEEGGNNEGKEYVLELARWGRSKNWKGGRGDWWIWLAEAGDRIQMKSDVVEEENEENNEIENEEEYSERCMHYRTVWSWLLGCTSITTSSPPSMPPVPSYDDSGISGLAKVLEDGGVGTDGVRLMGEGLVQIGEEDIKRIVDIREGDIKGEEDGEVRK